MTSRVRRSPGGPRGRSRAAAYLVLLGALSACAGEQDGGLLGDERAGGALHAGDAAFELCMPAPAGQDVLLGDTLLTNRSSSTVTLRSLDLVGARRLALVGAYVVEPLANEEGGTDLVGLRWAGQTEDLPAGWRQPLAGHDLPPGDSVNLVLHLTDTEEGGRLRAARITYDLGGERHTERTRTALAVTPGRCDGARPVPPDEDRAG